MCVCVNYFLYACLSFPDLDCKLLAKSFSIMFTALLFTSAVGLELGYFVSLSVNPLYYIDMIISFAQWKCENKKMHLMHLKY